MMKVKFTKKRYYDKILRQPGDIVNVDDRIGRAYLNNKAAVLVKTTKKGHDYYKAGRKRQPIAMPTMSDISERLSPTETVEDELEELNEDMIVEEVKEEVKKEVKKETDRPHLKRQYKTVPTDPSGKLDVVEPKPLSELTKIELIALLEDVGLGTKGSKIELIKRMEKYNDIG